MSGVIIFELLLLLGLPLGEFILAGKDKGVLQRKAKQLTISQILIQAFFAIVVAHKIDLLNFIPIPQINVLIWFVFVAMLASTFFNLISPSKKERLVMGLINIILVILLSLMLFA